MAYNVVLQKQVAAYNVDSYNRSVKADEDVENGSVFKLVQKTAEAGEKVVWKAEQAAAADTGLWMAMSPEIVTVVDAMGVEYRGLNVDPRAYTNVKGKVFDAVLLQKGDIIEMTGENIADVDTKDYLVVDAASMKLKADNAAGDGFALHKVDTGILHIGSAVLAKSHPKTYVYEVVNN
ncbi:MAG TPA: hypothetical protein DCW90_09895 [Lachnospiraceae bacterium]|nr:hypothetical protein [Lachnospiraceae bacterium]